MEHSEEQIIFQIILHSGTARAESYKALRDARAGNIEEAGISFDKAKEEMDKAHKIHRDLLANPEVISSAPSLLMVHAQDHLMTALAENTLIIEINELLNTVRNLSERIEKLEKHE
jgi:PTS system cellobiose-specific IIA component